MTPLALVLALVAAVCNAASSVLQRKANLDQPAGRRFGVALLADLVRRATWLFGLLAMLVSFLLQATALGIGTLSAVEPVLVLELPLSIILAALVLGHPLARRDWVSASVMAAGLAALIIALSPTDGHGVRVDVAVELIATVAALAAIAVMVALANAAHGAARAAWYGIASGSGFGLSASMMKIAVEHLETSGITGLLTAWETYAMVTSGIGALVLVQAALHAGTLVAAQPGITLFDPLVSLLWGTIVLGEQTRTGGWLVLATAGAADIAVAALILSRSSGVG